MDRYRPERDISPRFLDQVAGWIAQGGEVLVVLRYLRAAGSKDFAFCHTRSEFELLVDTVGIGTDIVVFREPQLPLRGIVDQQFLEAACQAIPDGSEYLLVSKEVKGDRQVCHFVDIGECHTELRESLNELFGTAAAIGLCPSFCVADHEGLISAAKGGIDGPR